MPVYRKGKATWRVRIFHKGKRRDWLVHGTKADTEAFEARKRVQLEAGEPVDVRVAPTFSDFCVSRYKPHAEMHLKASTWSVRVYQIATLIEQFGLLRLTEISPEQIDLFKRKRTREGARAITVNNELAVLQAVLSFARSIGVPAAHLKLKWVQLYYDGPRREQCQLLD